MFSRRLVAFLTVLLLASMGYAPAATLTPQPCAATPPAPGGPQVLLIARETSQDMELMLNKEVGAMICMLEKTGLNVKVASESGKPIAGGATTLTPDLKLAEVRVEDYVGVIVPCMAAGLEASSVRLPVGAVEIVKKAATQGKPVAAQQSGVEILGKAGVLDGKQFASDSDFHGSFPRGIYKGTGVVQDGKITTSGTCPYIARNSGAPDSTTELIEKFIASVASVR